MKFQQRCAINALAFTLAVLPKLTLENTNCAFAAPQEEPTKTIDFESPISTPAVSPYKRESYQHLMERFQQYQDLDNTSARKALEADGNSIERALMTYFKPSFANTSELKSANIILGVEHYTDEAKQAVFEKIYSNLNLEEYLILVERSPESPMDEVRNFTFGKKRSIEFEQKTSDAHLIPIDSDQELKDKLVITVFEYYMLLDAQNLTRAGGKLHQIHHMILDDKNIYSHSSTSESKILKAIKQLAKQQEEYQEERASKIKNNVLNASEKAKREGKKLLVVLGAGHYSNPENSFVNALLDKQPTISLSFYRKPQIRTEEKGEVGYEDMDTERTLTEYVDEILYKLWQEATHSRYQGIGNPRQYYRRELEKHKSHKNKVIPTEEALNN